MNNEQRVEAPAQADEGSSFSPVDNEPPLRWQRLLRLAPRRGLGVGRRAIIFALLTWLPVALWALFRNRFLEAPTGEPLLQHYGIHVRCLVVIPLLIIGEATLHKATLRYIPQFFSSGLVTAAMRPRIDALLHDVRRWRDASLPWMFVLGAALAWSFADRPAARDDALLWAAESDGSLGFGGAWLAYVVRPIFIALLLGWLWRIALLFVLLWRIGRLGLDLVPSHPDRVGGLGFLKRLPGAFAPVTFALSAMVSSRWAHDVVHHGQALEALRLPAAALVVGWTLLLLVPLLALTPALHAAKRAALPVYGSLVAKQGRLVRRRWIDGKTAAEEPLLEPAGVGPIADAAAMFDAVRSMRVLPIGRASLMAIIVPIVVPMLIVVALRIPVGELLLKLFKALV